VKAVILAGGYGSRLSEETQAKPKPMVEIGGYPILWHIMKIYSYYGVNDFILCLGYKAHMIKEYFSNYYMNRSVVTFDMSENKAEIHNNNCEPWKITIVDTGEDTLTGGRLKRVQSFVGNDTFCFTYGDGVSNVDIRQLISFHKEQGTLATLTAVNPPGRYGALDLAGNKVVRFKEKTTGPDSWINGGFFVLEPEVFDLIEGDQTSWETEPLEYLTGINQLSAFRHEGFWMPMDTLRDKMRLEEMWSTGKALWKVW
jgi:glucose-1-phosphate cytidylyltransferase